MKQVLCDEEAVVGLVGRGLLVAVGVCLLVAAALFFWAGDKPGRVPHLNVQLLPDEETAAVASSEDSLERPLFWITRRPVVPEEVVAEESSESEQEVIVEPLEGVRLIGILAKDDSFTALLEVDDKVVRVQKGVAVKQWSVSGITEREVFFGRQGKKSVLSLERKTHQSIKLEF